jgi:hypothetical protein
VQRDEFRLGEGFFAMMYGRFFRAARQDGGDDERQDGRQKLSWSHGHPLLSKSAERANNA